jgi:hypothetical protein
MRLRKRRYICVASPFIIAVLAPYDSPGFFMAIFQVAHTVSTVLLTLTFANGFPCVATRELEQSGYKRLQPLRAVDGAYLMKSLASSSRLSLYLRSRSGDNWISFAGVPEVVRGT